MTKRTKVFIDDETLRKFDFWTIIKIILLKEAINYGKCTTENLYKEMNRLIHVWKNNDKRE